MSRPAVLWTRVAERHQLKKALRDTVEVGAPDGSDGPVDDDPFAGFDATFDDGEDREPAIESVDDDPFAGFDATFDDIEDREPAMESTTAPAAPIVDANFDDKADLWLTRSHTSLEHALVVLGLPWDLRPTRRPLLIFGSRRQLLAEGAPQVFQCHRVKVPHGGWPPHLRSVAALAPNAAAEILATSPKDDGASGAACFVGETVAVEIQNPLLAPDRWIVLWPRLEFLPETVPDDAAARNSADRVQWRQVRRVVWCADREQIAPRDVLDWLVRDWHDVPVRIALFQARQFVRDERRTEARSSVLPRVRRALEKLDLVGRRPWTVAGP